MAVASKALTVPVVCLAAAKATEPEARMAAAAAADTMNLRMARYSWEMTDILVEKFRVVYGPSGCVESRFRGQKPPAFPGPSDR